MIALYRSGYRTRALEVFDELRRTMHEEFGTAPSGRITELWQVIQAGDTAAVDATNSYGRASYQS